MPSVVGWTEYLGYWIGALVFIGVGAIWGIITLIKNR